MSAALATGEIDTQLFELSIKVGTLQTGLFCDTGHRAIFTCQVVLEISLLKLVARLAQWLIQYKSLCSLQTRFTGKTGDRCCKTNRFSYWSQLLGRRNK